MIPVMIQISGFLYKYAKLEKKPALPKTKREELCLLK